MTTRWTPDTDPTCQIDIDRDRDGNLVFSWHQPSAVHGTIDAVRGENIRKNRLCAEVESFGVSPTGYRWAIDQTAERTIALTVTERSLSTSERNQLLSRLQSVDTNVRLG